MIGSYSPNSIAGRGVRQIPSSKRRGTAASDAQPTMIGQPRAMPMPTRADNIAAARADGTFDAKRNAFNAANSGSYMNEQGIIGPRAPSPTGGAVMPSAPAPAPAAKSPSPPTAQIGKPRKPATFDGKSTATPFPSRPAPAIKETPMSGPGEPTLEKRASALGQAHAIINSPDTKKLMADIEAGKEKRAAQQPPVIAQLPAEKEPKLTPPHLLFADRAPPAKPAPISSTPRAIDSYVSAPKNKSIMTGKTGAQMAEEEAKAKKKAAAEKLFRRPYLPNRPVSLN